MPRSGKVGLSRPHRIFETRQFLQDLGRLGAVAEKRLALKLREHIYPILAEDPYLGPGIKRLKNWEPPTWRCRVGEWRFFYEIDDRQRIVFMIAAHHRKQAYR